MTFSNKKTTYKQTNSTTGLTLTLGINDLKNQIKGKLVISMQESYQKESSKLKKTISGKFKDPLCRNSLLIYN